jgi:beta-lactamase class D
MPKARRIAAALALTVVAGPVTAAGAEPRAEKPRPRVVVRPDLLREFAAAGTSGTMVVRQSGRRERIVIVGERRSRRRYLPSSTFKVPNSLIAIDTGVASGRGQRYPGPNPNYRLDGAPLLPAACEGDLTLQTAFANSCIPIYQRIARAVGAERYRTLVRAFDYGNARTGGAPVDEFWLRGPFGISAREQVQFLERLRNRRLPVAPRAMRAVRRMMVLRREHGVTVRGKTGYVFSTPQRVGWWVGSVERRGQVSTFALNLDVDSPEDLAARTAVGERILRELGAFG